MVVWTFHGITFLWDWNENWPVATAEFSKFAGILSAALSQHHLSGFEIAQLESITSTSFFIVMSPKTHLTSHSCMSASRWVTIALWLSGSRRPFLYSSVYSCHLLLICSASVMSIPFLFFFKPIFEWNQTQVSHIAGRCFNLWATREAHQHNGVPFIPYPYQQMILSECFQCLLVRWMWDWITLFSFFLSQIKTNFQMHVF